MSLTSIDLGLREVLADPVRRQAFFRTITQDDIAAQIRALRKARNLTQAKLAGLAGMKQSAVSRIEQAEYASWTLATLFRVAAALDARWRMSLEPAEEAVKELEGIENAIGNAMIAGAPEQPAGGTSSKGSEAIVRTDLIRHLFWLDANKALGGSSSQSEWHPQAADAGQRQVQANDALSLLRGPVDTGAHPAQQQPAVSFGG